MTAIWSLIMGNEGLGSMIWLVVRGVGGKATRAVHDL